MKENIKNNKQFQKILLSLKYLFVMKNEEKVMKKIKRGVWEKAEIIDQRKFNPDALLAELE